MAPLYYEGGYEEMSDLDERYLEIIKPGEPVDTCYGLETIELGSEHIAALIAGKQIYTTINYDEYAIIVKMRPPEALSHADQSTLMSAT